LEQLIKVFLFFFPYIFFQGSLFTKSIY